MMIDHYAGGHPPDVMTGCHHVHPRPVFDFPLPLIVVGFGIEIDNLNSMGISFSLSGRKVFDN
jgi:hypothetical protein